MTPGARIAAAIEVLDAIAGGTPAEKALTNWARAHRFAGSGDRAAIRDHVFDALRCRRSFAWLGGSETGRGLMIGMIRAAGDDPAELFNGQGYAPDPLSSEEAGVRPEGNMPDAVRLDCADWILPQLRRSLGPDTEPILTAMRTRADVILRVNLARCDRETASAALAREGIETRPHPAARTALTVTGGARRIRNSNALQDGLVELQDASSQAAVLELEAMSKGRRVLDYCAGGGGKSLGLAALGAEVTAHDIDPARMKDIGPRARRAGATIATATPAELRRHSPYELVLVDAPCSGSGAWRRQPEAKWSLTEGRLSELVEIQSKIVREAAELVAPGGVLAYATCSLLEVENEAIARDFLNGSDRFTGISMRRWSPNDGADGFFLAMMRNTPQG